MRNVVALGLVLLVGCSGAHETVRDDPPPDEEPLTIRDETPADPEHPECPPVSCAGPYEEDAVLARAVSRAREQLWRDEGGEGPIPESEAEARWLLESTALSAGAIDRAGLVGVEGARSTSDRTGAAAFLAAHTADGWYLCDAGRRAGTRGPPRLSPVGAVTAPRLSPHLGPGVVASYRATDLDDEARAGALLERTLVCSAGEARPICHGLVQMGSGEVQWGEGADAPEEPPTSMRARFDGAGRLILEDARGESPLAGAHPIRGLRCSLDP